MGYARFELAALVALDRVHAPAREFVNFFQPVQKLVEKTRDGARVTKRYDRAQTPYQRLLATGRLAPGVAADLAARYAALNPLQLKLELEAAQAKPYTKVARNEPPVRPRRTSPEKTLT